MSRLHRMHVSLNTTFPKADVYIRIIHKFISTKRCACRLYDTVWSCLLCALIYKWQRTAPTGQHLQDGTYRTAPTGRHLQDGTYRTAPTGRHLRDSTYTSRGVAVSTALKTQHSYFYIVKVKVKIALEQATQDQSGSRGITVFFL